MLNNERLRLSPPRRGWLAKKGRDLLLIAGAMIPLTACGDFLDDLIGVDAPSRVIASSLDHPKNAELLVNSAGTDLECALAHYIVAGGLVGNELEIGTTLIVMKEYDKRNFSPIGSAYTNTTCDSEGSVGVYVPLSVARWQADNALEKLESWTDAEVPNRMALIARAAVYSGYAHVLIGEGMCSAAFDLGPELSREQVFERAEQRFTRAMEAAEAAGRTDILNLARVGRARARLNLGNMQEAAADARLVPEDFRFDATYSTNASRRENAVFTRNVRIQIVTIDPSYRNLTFGGVDDPRVELIDVEAPASDGVTDLWYQTKYPDASSPIPLATWEEAQLIIAEAENAAGNTVAAVATLNQLHERAGLPAFGGGTAEEVLDHIIQERSRELFLEGHHLGDVNRYQIPLTPAPGAPFKDGGGEYQAQTCFPLPDTERDNNPNINS